MRLSIGFLLSAVLLFSTAASAEPAKVVKMGLILPLTGAHAQTAEAMRVAAELAYDELSDETKLKFKLLFEDDQLNGTVGVTAFNKLVAADKISVALTFGGQTVAPVASIAEAKKIPLFGLTADPSLVQGKSYAFQHWLSSEQQARALFTALDPANQRRLAFVSTTHNAALDILRRFQDEARARGFESVYVDDFSPQDTDLRTPVLHLRKLQPDAILTVLVAPHMSLFCKQLRAAQVSAPIYSSTNAEVSDEVAAAQGAMEGVTYAGPDLDPGFVQRFSARFGRPPEFAAPHVYDSVKLVAAAIEHGALSAEAINSYLHSIRDFHGGMGVYGIERGFSFAVRAVVKRIHGGKFEMVRPHRH